MPKNKTKVGEITQIKNINHEDITLLLRIIDKLLSMPAGEQIYRSELNILFSSLELASKPIFKI